MCVWPQNFVKLKATNINNPLTRVRCRVPVRVCVCICVQMQSPFSAAALYCCNLSVEQEGRAITTNTVNTHQSMPQHVYSSRVCVWVWLCHSDTFFACTCLPVTHFFAAATEGFPPADMAYMWQGSAGQDTHRQMKEPQLEAKKMLNKLLRW